MSRGAGLLALVALCGCECGDERVAELVSRHHVVDRSTAVAPDRWTTARVGDGFGLGDAVRTGESSRAQVRLDDGGGIELDSHTIVRFVASPPGRRGTSVGIEAGTIVLEAEGEGIAVVTGIGTAFIEHGGAARLRGDDRGTRLDVTLGTARFDAEGGRAVTLAAGEHVEVGMGGAILEEEPAPPPVSTAVPPPAAAADAGTEAPDAEPVPADATLPAALQPAMPADVAIAAGESPTIHDTEGPTAVRVRFGALCDEGVLRLIGARVPPVRARGAAVLALGGGAHRYTLQCVRDGRVEASASSSGTIVVRRDSGAAPLAGRIPHNAVDADGRRYTVLYQNRLPSLTFQWTDPTASGPFVLHLQSEGGGGRVLNAPAPRVTLASGELGEGRHRFWFTGGGGRRSPETSVRVGFDNAAPTAWLRDVAAPSGAGVRVAGAVLDGWTATVGDRPLPLDENNRFETDLAPSGDERAVAIRIARPGRGVHYYLRRPARAAP